MRNHEMSRVLVLQVVDRWMPTKYQLSVEALLEGVFIGNVTSGEIRNIAVGKAH